MRLTVGLLQTGKHRRKCTPDFHCKILHMSLVLCDSGGLLLTIIFLFLVLVYMPVPVLLFSQNLCKFCTLELAKLQTDNTTD